MWPIILNIKTSWTFWWGKRSPTNVSHIWAGQWFPVGLGWKLFIFPSTRVPAEEKQLQTLVLFHQCCSTGLLTPRLRLTAPSHRSANALMDFPELPRAGFPLRQGNPLYTSQTWAGVFTSSGYLTCDWLILTSPIPSLEDFVPFCTIHFIGHISKTTFWHHFSWSNLFTSQEFSILTAVEFLYQV